MDLKTDHFLPLRGPTRSPRALAVVTPLLYDRLVYIFKLDQLLIKNLRFFFILKH